uniref:Uncharacterized protein n=1 Tax=Fagus sylvatica TaxID=28930 RepID=A0A2N9H9D3_FAGSY
MHETGWLGLAGVVVVLRWLGFLLGFLLKHETGWLGLAGVVVGFSVEARNGVAWACRRGGG